MNEPNETLPQAARPGRLQDKVCLVTGAGSGIGKSVAQIAHAEGGIVVALDYDEQAAKSIAEQLGGKSLALRADVSDQNAVDAAVSTVMAKFGRIDVLVNVAGINDKMTPMEELDRALWARVFDINVWGTMVVTERVTREMLKSGGGSVVHVSSTASFVAGGGGVAYTASKGAISSMTREMAYELADRGIRVNAVAPGVTATNLRANTIAILGNDKFSDASIRLRQRAAEKFPANVPMGRRGEADEVAKTIVFLASDDASYITGTVVVVDGGLTIH